MFNPEKCTYLNRFTNVLIGWEQEILAELEKRPPRYRLGSRDEKSPTKDELTEIYDTYYPPIYRFIYRQLGDVDICRELSSEVFCRMLQTIKNDPEIIQHLAPWLYCTARNIVVDHFRRQKFRNHLPLKEELVQSSNNTAEDAALRIATGQMRAALQELTAEQRQVILLKFIEGLSNQEVADILSKPIGAIKSLQHRALCTLRELLGPREESESHEHEFIRNPRCSY